MRWLEDTPGVYVPFNPGNYTQAVVDTGSTANPPPIKLGGVLAPHRWGQNKDRRRVGGQLLSAEIGQSSPATSNSLPELSRTTPGSFERLNHAQFA